MLATAVWLVLDRYLNDTRVYTVLSSIRDEEWQFTLVLLLASAMLGTISAALFSYVETNVLDRRRISEFKERNSDYNQTNYDDEWNAYVDSLNEEQNTYLSGIAMMFFFESRTSVASVALGTAWTLWSTSISEFIVAGGIIIVGLGLFWTSDHSHRVLAKYRHRRFGKVR